jgi:predicted  nucleic acid-binding Zn-ribbon protein
LIHVNKNEFVSGKQMVIKYNLMGNYCNEVKTWGLADGHQKIVKDFQFQILPFVNDRVITFNESNLLAVGSYSLQPFAKDNTVHEPRSKLSIVLPVIPGMPNAVVKSKASSKISSHMIQMKSCVMALNNKLFGIDNKSKHIMCWDAGQHEWEDFFITSSVVKLVGSPFELYALSDLGDKVFIWNSVFDKAPDKTIPTLTNMKIRSLTCTANCQLFAIATDGNIYQLVNGKWVSLKLRGKDLTFDGNKVYVLSLSGNKILSYQFPDWKVITKWTGDMHLTKLFVSNNDIFAVDALHGGILLHRDMSNDGENNNNVKWSVISNAPGSRYLLFSSHQILLKITPDKSAVFKYNPSDKSWSHLYGAVDDVAFNLNCSVLYFVSNNLVHCISGVNATIAPPKPPAANLSGNDMKSFPSNMLMFPVEPVAKDDESKSSQEDEEKLDPDELEEIEIISRNAATQSESIFGSPPPNVERIEVNVQILHNDAVVVAAQNSGDYVINIVNTDRVIPPNLPTLDLQLRSHAELVAGNEKFDIMIEQNKLLYETIKSDSDKANSWYSTILGLAKPVAGGVVSFLIGFAAAKISYMHASMNIMTTSMNTQEGKNKTLLSSKSMAAVAPSSTATDLTDAAQKLADGWHALDDSKFWLSFGNFVRLNPRGYLTANDQIVCLQLIIRLF